MPASLEFKVMARQAPRHRRTRQTFPRQTPDPIAANGPKATRGYSYGRHVFHLWPHCYACAPNLDY